MKILYGIFLKTIIIDTRVKNLKSELKITGDDFYVDFNEKVKNVNPDNRVSQFENWYVYLYDFKINLVDIISSITIYNDYLSLEFIVELNLIENQLFSTNVFEGSKMLKSDNLTFAMIELQEILIHNKHLQGLITSEFSKYEKIFKIIGEEYRKKHYSEIKCRN